MCGRSYEQPIELQTILDQNFVKDGHGCGKCLIQRTSRIWSSKETDG